jgi:hypothetical protein
MDKPVKTRSKLDTFIKNSALIVEYPEIVVENVLVVLQIWRKIFRAASRTNKVGGSSRRLAVHFT